MKRYRRGILLAVTAVFFVLLSFGLGLLVYALSEPLIIDLGHDEESFVLALQEQLRLGHVALVAGGEKVFYIHGVKYEVHVLTVLERLGLALRNAFAGDYGQAVSQNASVGSLIGWPLGRAFIYLFAFGLFAFIPGLLAPKQRNNKRSLMYLGIGLFCLGFSLGFFLGWKQPYVGMAFFAASLLALLMAALSYFPIKKPLMMSVLTTLVFFLGTLGFFALYPNLNEAGSMLGASVSTQDNHVYAPMLFFLLIMGFVPCWLSLFFGTRKKSEDLQG